ncbi:MAG: hypothetical protein AAF587_18055 [Bacteroidota bacterium]
MSLGRGQRKDNQHLPGSQRGVYAKIHVNSLWGFFCLCLPALLPSCLFAQSSLLRQQYPFSLPENEVLQFLHQDWQHDGLRYLDVPFELHGLEMGEFSCVFDLWDTFDSLSAESDTVYLLFEGLAWEAELELNGKFLGLHHDPLERWEVPVLKTWLVPEKNTLTLRLFVDQPKPLYCRPFLGIVRPVSFLTPHQWKRRKQLNRQTISFADTVGLVAPYFRTTAYSFDLFEALKNLYPLKQLGIRHIYFPFPAGDQFENLCRQLGFVVVDSIRDDTYVCPVNAYPNESIGFPMSPRFWIDEAGDYTSYYGNVYLWQSKRMNQVPEGDHFLLALLIFFPLFASFFIKLLNPAFFSQQVSLLLTPKRFVDSPNETLYSHTGLLWGLIWIRTICITIYLTLLMYYIQLENQWILLNIFREWSLSSVLFYQEKSLLRLLLISGVIIIFWLLIKYLLISLIGGIFRIKAMVARIASLDVAGTYPLILILPIPMALILFMDQLWGGILAIFLLILTVGYISRQVYVLYIGLDRLFSFSSAMKFLYICTFIIVPYMVWF